MCIRDRSIDTNLDVGIGTDNARARLDVYKGTSATDVDIFSVRSKTGAFNIQCSDTDAANPEWRLRTYSSEDIVFSPCGTGSSAEKVRIKSSGSVGIGSAIPAGKLDISHPTHTNLLVLKRTTGNTGTFSMQIGGADPGLIFDVTGISDDFVFRPGGAEKLRITSAGSVLPAASGTQNLGSTTLEWGNVYIADSKNIFFGSDQDAEIYHNGSSLYMNNSTGNTYIRSGGGQILMRPSSSYDAIVAKTNEVELYYNSQNHSTPKLKTSATGITVDGEVSASQDYPNYRPTADFNFEAEKKLDPRITYFRSGPASYVNQFGKVVLVGDNEPRFDYGYEYVNANSHKLSKGESKGLLIEESRTNLVSYSIYDGDKSGTAQTSSGDTGNWDLTIGHATLTGGIDAPDGSNDAVRFTSLNTGYAILRIPIPAFTPNGSDNYILSFYARAISGTGTLMCDLNDGAPLLNGWTNNLITNEWVRIVVSGVPTGSASFIDLVSNSNTNRVIDFWGVQLEKGAFATSFIPTHGSVATRGYEAVTLEGTDFSDIFETDFKQFSLVADYDNTQTDDGTNYGIIDLWGESTGYDDRIEWFKDNLSPYHIETRSFGQGNATFANGNLSASNKTKSQRFATSWYVPDYSNTSSRRFVVSMGGEAVDVISDGSGTTVPQITRMGIGCNPTRLDFTPGLLHFKRLMVYNKTLSDGQLQNLSSQ